MHHTNKRATGAAFLLLAAALLPLGGCKAKDAAKTAGVNMDKDESYAIGMYIASQFSIPDVTYDYKAFMDGFKAYTEAEETRFSMDDAITKIQAAFERISARDAAAGEAASAQALADGQAYLEENGRKTGVTTTASGLQYEVLAEGSGARPLATDTVRVNYEGTLIDGTVFDSSYERGQPIEFPLNGVIPGWTEGLQLMTEGSTYRFVIPSALAYGTQGAGGAIPPNSTLIFKVELLSVVNNETGAAE